GHIDKPHLGKSSLLTVQEHDRCVVAEILMPKFELENIAPEFDYLQRLAVDGERNQTAPEIGYRIICNLQDIARQHCPMLAPLALRHSKNCHELVQVINVKLAMNDLRGVHGGLSHAAGDHQYVAAIAFYKV